MSLQHVRSMVSVVLGLPAIHSKLHLSEIISPNIYMYIYIYIFMSQFVNQHTPVKMAALHYSDVIMGASNHQPQHCLLNRLVRRGSKKTSKLRVSGLCAKNSPVTGEFPALKASNAENVSIWWCHHVPTWKHLVHSYAKDLMACLLFYHNFKCWHSTAIHCSLLILSLIFLLWFPQ